MSDDYKDIINLPHHVSSKKTADADAGQSRAVLSFRRSHRVR